jgi:hypothetical protein
MKFSATRGMLVIVALACPMLAASDLEVNDGRFLPAVSNWSIDEANQLVADANRLREQARMHESSAYLERAINMYRAAEGPDTLEQLQAMKPLLDYWFLIGDWRRVDDILAEMGRIYARHYEQNDSIYVDVHQERARWHLRRYAVSPAEERLPELTSAYTLYAEAIRISAANAGEKGDKVPELLENMAAVAYLFSQDSSAGSPLTRQPSTRLPVRRDEVDQRNGYLQGRHALETLVKLYSHPETDALDDLVNSYLLLADWHLSFGHYQRARDAYREAWRLSVDMDEQHRNDMFGQAVLLPRFEILQEVANVPVRGVTRLTDEVPVRMDVDRYGHSAGFEILVADPAERRRLEPAVSRKLAGTLIRPRIVEGQPQPWRNVVIQVK